MMTEHTCHARGCKTAVPPKMFMCRPHWYKVPVELRRLVWAHYVPGQEITKSPTRKYLEVTREAVLVVAKMEGKA